ncbi:MAG: hypothetical protein DBO98_03270 [Candidatus Liberibacter europaeus]|nr:hypothetical protein [Candidatus Liberibacter europaeus]
MAYKQLRLKTHSISYLCRTYNYTIPWDVKDPTTVYAEFIKDTVSIPLEYGEEFTVDCDEGELSLIIDYDKNAILHIFEGEKLKYIEKSSDKHNSKSLTSRIDDSMDEISKISPKIDKVEKEIKEELKNTTNLVQVHSFSLADHTKTLDELQSVLEKNIVKTQETIKSLEQDVKNLKNTSCDDIELLKSKIEELISAQEKMKNLEKDIAELKNKPPIDLTSINADFKKLNDITNNLKKQEEEQALKIQVLEKIKDEKATKHELEKLKAEVVRKEELDSFKAKTDLHPVKSRLEEVETAVKKVDKIDDIATELEEVRKKAEHVELLKKQTDQIAKDASDTAKRIEAVHQKAKQVDSLAQATNTIEQKVDNLSGKTEEVCKKIEQIDLSKIEGLDPQTQKYLQTIQKQLDETQLRLQEGDSGGRPTIHMKNKAGQLVAQIWYNTYDNLVMGRVNDKGGFASYLVFRPNGGIDINSETFVDGSSPSIFDEMAKRLTPHFLGLIQGRTTTRCARLNRDPSLNEVISGTDIHSWSYPVEDNSGYLSGSLHVWNLYPSDEQKQQKWKVIGRTRGYYFPTWYWIQEVIDPKDVIFKTVGSSTLADNLIDLKTMQNKINTIDALQTKISQLETELTADKTKISQLENADKSNRTFASKLLAIVKDLPQDLKAMEQRIKELEARSA